MNKYILIIIMCVSTNYIYAQTQMQIEFEKFLLRFPVCTWMDLDSIRKLTPQDMSINDSIPIDVANRNMWDEGNRYKPDCIYNHLKNEKITTDRPKWGTTRPPFIRTIDGKYRTSHEDFGLFIQQRGIQYNEVQKLWEPSDEYSCVYPLARIDLYDDVVVLVVLYKYMPESTFIYAIDLYTYTKSDQQMCSAMSIGDEGPASDIVFSNDLTISFKDWYEIGFGDGGSSTYAYANEKYILSPDGYLSEIFVEWPQCGYIVDPDGYVNMRKSPDVKSEVVATISSDSFVVCYPVKGTKWLRVWEFIDMKKEVYRRDCEGYIHSSRFEDQYEYESKQGW